MTRRMKKTMIKTPRQRSWLRSLAEAAKEQNVALPPFTGRAMAAARTPSVGGGRFVTFKRRLVPADQAGVDGIEWALWLDQDDLPERIAAFREPVDPKPGDVANALALIKGWLLDGWTPAETKAAAGRHPRAQPVDDAPEEQGTSTLSSENPDIPNRPPAASPGG
jgi:hypothetical protein